MVVGGPSGGQPQTVRGAYRVGVVAFVTCGSGFKKVCCVYISVYVGCVGGATRVSPQILRGASGLGCCPFNLLGELLQEGAMYINMCGWYCGVTPRSHPPRYEVGVRMGWGL